MAELSERIQRRIDQFLDDAEVAVAAKDWSLVSENAQAVLDLDPGNSDARSFLAAADRALSRSSGPSVSTDELEPGTPVRQAASVGGDSTSQAAPIIAQAQSIPASFVSGRYVVQRFLGEGGKKRVYLAHDEQLDRDVAFALLKSDGLDVDGLARIRREAQAMGRLGDHPHIVTVFDIGDEQGQPYIVSQYMAGGSLQALIEQADDHRVPLDTALTITDQICQALEHAHTHGVIHRDLKPGNVWLTAPSSQPSPTRGEGVPTAKLGDFGLAIALDRSRLTQAGMMVGTVAYMAPEQAMATDVTARSDLYSLGCLLYELITGRPPFVGDESVAIITQHLNASPVAPSWHRPDCPPGLEALILRLLEKDASKRPESAAEVRQALAGVSAPSLAGGEGVSSPPAAAGEGSSPIDPVYRQTFVGREQELKQLQQAFDAALSGQGSLVAVVGEPGIGKTALSEQLATYVAVRGGKTLVGHCYEEGSLSLPYLAFVEAVRTYVLQREPDDLKRELGTNAGDVARLVSEIRDRVNVEPRPAGGDPDEDRWRLLQAVTGFLRNAATVQPLVIVLEDLHWADRGSLDLLLHLARNLVGSRLLVVATYRDVEVDRSHPLSNTLAELRRSTSFQRISLRGLTVDEVHRMMNNIRGQEVPWSRAEAIHRQTEGNPLFVQEVLRYLVEEGLVTREGGRYIANDAYGEDSIPEGLRDVIGKRLSRLSEKTNQVLSVAAVIGREFRLEVLQTVAGLPEEELYTALEEATERAVVENRSAIGAMGFRFTHGFFRQTLYEEIFPPRRIRFHQQIGRALETINARRPEEHAAELADHFAQSTEREDLEKALRYSELAAQRSLGVFAYSVAVRHLERALQVQDVLDPDDKAKRCDLLLALGDAMLPLEEPGRVADTVSKESFALAELLGDSRRAVRAALQAFEGGARAAASGIFTQSGEGQEWARRADKHAQDGTVERVYADMYLGLSIFNLSREAAHASLRRAVERARALDDDTALFGAASYAINNLQALQDWGLVGELTAEVLGRDRHRARSRDLQVCLTAGASVLFNRGDRAGMERARQDLAELAERSRDTTTAANALGGPVFLAYLDGRLDEALDRLDDMLEQGRAAGLSLQGGPAGGLGPLGQARARYYLGRSLEPALGYLVAPPRANLAGRAVALALLGQRAEALAIVAGFGDVGSPGDETGQLPLSALFEAAVLCEERVTAAALASRFAPLAGCLNAFSGLSIGRLLGDAARLLDHPDDARGYYMQALDVSERVSFRPEIALIRLDLAELLLEHYPDERAEASDHLDFAIKEFEAMKMAPLLERARALKAQSGR